MCGIIGQLVYKNIIEFDIQLKRLNIQFSFEVLFQETTTLFCSEAQSYSFETALDQWRN